MKTDVRKERDRRLLGCSVPRALNILNKDVCKHRDLSKGPVEKFELFTYALSFCGTRRKRSLQADTAEA